MQSQKFEEQVLASKVLNKDLEQLINDGAFTRFESTHEGKDHYTHYGVVDHTGGYPFPDSVNGTYRINRKRFVHLWTDDHNNVYEYQMLGVQ
ncbi:hypothetical protein VCRA2128O305_10058 [Vibrio crassostreae]|uniref:hypothetical protein n=1 Tax=Vibrio crassostreae TaxID=246167 RepID=UPI0005DF85F7|nr:hypothetical protein [Vibrio crassostreae]RPF10737.1 hypothetical protein EDB14_1829 [Vibrio crassostreae]TCT67639.1 hypothetical protein EDB44_101687 [Vibrio crassostreae]TCT86930.1 hypothetical protein EDB43_10155 [Vibrio crassostreae]TCU07889.1 hypothetical protein EDB47_10255 [Vibrio crassostreae]TDW13295.1 hypothetical protein EDB45_10154 [Vibrio crassostreae]